MKPGKLIAHFLILIVTVILFSCNRKSAKDNIDQSKAGLQTASEEDKSKSRKDSQNTNGTLPLARLSGGNGSLSFKFNGKLYEDKEHSRCWANGPMGMLHANGDGFKISWDMAYQEGKESYHMSKEHEGRVSITIGETMYWTASVLGKDYIDVKITNVKNKYTLRLLSGTFEGVLEDKEGNIATITEGKFETNELGNMRPAIPNQ